MNLRRYSWLLLILVLAGCANRGIGPQGGPKDSIPPVILKETPLNGTLNYHGKRVEIQCDEYLQLNDVSKHVIISPPQQRPPEVKAIGKKVILVFDEDLQDSTTYTIDFGDAICDYHEKIPLKGYSLSFSTGDHIDSLEINGYVVNAEDLNPVSGVVVGIHANKEDSAFSTLPFTRIGKSDSNGFFSVKNIRTGSYRLYGLNDVSRDYLYQPGEGLAFSDTLITPVCHTELEQDTTWKPAVVLDSLGKDTIALREIDTIQTVSYTYFEPSGLLLWYFWEDKTRQYFQRCYREQAHMFRLQFGAPQNELPQIRALRPSEVDSLGNDSAWVDWTQYMVLQANKGKDSLIYWLTDSVVIRQDSLIMEMTYLKTDSVYNLVPQTDTVYAVYRPPYMSEKAKAQKEKNKKPPVLKLISNASAKFEVYNQLVLSSPTPIAEWAVDSLHLFQKIDTAYKPIPFTVSPVDSSKMRIAVEYKWEPEKQYELRIDSAAFRDIYGVVNNASKEQMTVKSLEEYSTLLIKLVPYEPKAVLQLLNEKDEVVLEFPANAEGTKFEYLEPKAYYLRLFIDENGDGKWTTGDWATHRQPEPVYYFPSKLSLRANWDFEETFDYTSIDQLSSKPQELLKDAADKKKK